MKNWKEEQRGRSTVILVCFALGSLGSRMIILLMMAQDLTINKSKALHLAFINLFLIKGHTVHRKSLQSPRHS